MSFLLAHPGFARAHNYANARSAKTMIKLSLHLLLGLGALNAHGATFTVHCDGRFEVSAHACSIKLSGQIEPGDADRLKAAMRSKLPPGWRFGDLLLHSMGGSVQSALEVSKVVRGALLTTSTYRMGRATTVGEPEAGFYHCVSACFLVWASEAERTTLAGHIGLHRPYLERRAYDQSPEVVSELQQRAVTLVTEHLKKEQVPNKLIEQMLQNASTQVYWLQEGDTDISGRAPWFEEMLIARCSFDPTYERDMLSYSMRVAQDHFSRKLKGKPTLGPDFEKYVIWRQKQNTCEYKIREMAQLALQK